MKRIDEFIEKWMYKLYHTDHDEFESDLNILLREVAEKQRWAASLWVEDSSIIEMPLVTDEWITNKPQ